AWRHRRVDPAQRRDQGIVRRRHDPGNALPDGARRRLAGHSEPDLVRSGIRAARGSRGQGLIETVVIEPGDADLAPVARPADQREVRLRPDGDLREAAPLLYAD